ncbi:MAG: DUF1294 domain-containing protein [Candidatus Pristimantibacillus lignocellulolyticus]|uniref:DUF1294 domain-containing protein n=1 Tax=Candidatus Pristimantibacillus lignocellulolyticus TaxID=2994561 RepID=A0A9J6ZC86_9BACL|nr:MAG: DUF1294 domain-containing protein [Candidatus Pristimantibacillus lignocellulolyticus]
MDTIYWIVGYILFLNVYLYWVMGKDKENARRNQPRIPERHIFLFSALGGAVGTYTAMYHFRHKTKHRSFKIGIPVIIIIHFILAILVVGALN